jgi:hypothetical protein
MVEVLCFCCLFVQVMRLTTPLDDQKRAIVIDSGSSDEEKNEPCFLCKAETHEDGIRTMRAPHGTVTFCTRSCMQAYDESIESVGGVDALMSPNERKTMARAARKARGGKVRGGFSRSDTWRGSLSRKRRDVHPMIYGSVSFSSSSSSIEVEEKAALPAPAPASSALLRKPARKAEEKVAEPQVKLEDEPVLQGAGHQLDGVDCDRCNYHCGRHTTVDGCFFFGCTCEGCIVGAENQELHKGVGGCLEERQFTIGPLSPRSPDGTPPASPVPLIAGDDADEEEGDENPYVADYDQAWCDHCDEPVDGLGIQDEDEDGNAYVFCSDDCSEEFWEDCAQCERFFPGRDHIFVEAGEGEMAVEGKCCSQACADAWLTEMTAALPAQDGPDGEDSGDETEDTTSVEAIRRNAAGQ